MDILPYVNEGGVAEGSAQLTGLEAALAIGLVRQSPQEVDRVKMIDVHIHVVNPQLPGVKTLPPFFDGPPKLVADALLEQMQDAGAEVLLGMGQLSSSKSDPLGIDFTLRVADFVPGLHPIGVADPTRTDMDHLQGVEKQLLAGRVKALKGYLGYLYHGPNSPGYIPYYELAARYEIPFIFHTWDNYSTVAKLKYAHPLLIDEVAVDHRDVNYVMAHFGYPWITDAAEVLYKNENVWADLSGVLVGDEAYFVSLSDQGVLSRVVGRIKQGIEYTERPDKFLYGTDWPLAPMRVYRDFVSRLFPEKYHAAVFHGNASKLFGLMVSA